MIADTERLIDGFRGLPAGMDGSKEPPKTSSEAAWYATNVTFRGGNGPRTRPGFREIPQTYWRNPQPIRSVDSITISDGVATVTTSDNHGYDNKDKVIIEGGTPTEINGIFTITVTGNTTFTFPTEATGTVTGTITARRDIDSTYLDDYINSTTSRDRYFNDIVAGIYVQGATIYQDPREGNPAQMIVVVDGKIMSLNFNEATVTRLNLSDEFLANDVPVYMTQAEKYLIIQTGKDEPRVFDGYTVRRASYFGSQVVPIGKQMAYGQGRLFVAVNDGSEIMAGDLVFGGSTSNVAITGSSAANPTVITTATAHGLSVGDQITIQGHSSSPPINSTYTVVTTPTATTFTISTAVTSAGVGGFVSRFNAGQDSDLLRFTETTFLNEGGKFSPTGKVGTVTGLVFLPVQDTNTGQGDLIAFCERGAVTFQVSAPREQWKSLAGFQRVLFENIGSVSDSILPVNGDLFFRSKEGNGIRTYRNARGEANTYGQTPVSAEIDPILKQDTLWMLDQISMVNFDNRLLITCWPRKLPRRATDQDQADFFAAQPVPTIYAGIAALDFQSVSAGRGKSAVVFDGVWTGLRVLRLVQGALDGDPRCFAVCLHQDDTGRRIEIWEVTKNDEYDTSASRGQRRILGGIVTKAFDMGDSRALKKLIRCDLWFNDLGGGDDFPFECELAYRPDDYSNFITWQRFERRFETDFLLADKNLLAWSERLEDPSWTLTNATIETNVTTNPLNAAFDVERLVEDTSTGDHQISRSVSLAGAQDYTFSIFVRAQGRSRFWLAMSDEAGAFGVQQEAHFDLRTQAATIISGATNATIEALGDDWFRCSITGTTITAATTTCRIGLLSVTGTSYEGDGFSGLLVWGAQVEASPDPTAYDPEPPQLLNYERGYAPQVRFPTPPRTTNLATDVPAYLGHDFTLRVTWAGRAHLGRLMLHGHRLVENVGGGTL
jgi:hypothetical protein